jgi:hypothetical protein
MIQTDANVFQGRATKVARQRGFGNSRGTTRMGGSRCVAVRSRWAFAEQRPREPMVPPRAADRHCPALTGFAGDPAPVAGASSRVAGSAQAAALAAVAVDLEKITLMVRAGPDQPSTAATPPSGSAPAASRKATVPEKAKPADTEAGTSPAKGMVRVHTNTKVFHREGDRWYGKTKEGKFMTEAEALTGSWEVVDVRAPAVLAQRFWTEDSEGAEPFSESTRVGRSLRTLPARRRTAGAAAWRSRHRSWCGRSDARSPY